MSVSRLGFSVISLIFTTVCFLPLTTAHEHEELEDGVGISGDPVDGILWAHIAVMFLAFGIIFPVGKYTKWYISQRLVLHG